MSHTEKAFCRFFETLGGVAFIVAILSAVWFAAVISDRWVEQ